MTDRTTKPLGRKQKRSNPHGRQTMNVRRVKEIVDGQAEVYRQAQERRARTIANIATHLMLDAAGMAEAEPEIAGDYRTAAGLLFEASYRVGRQGDAMASAAGWLIVQEDDSGDGGGRPEGVG